MANSSINLSSLDFDTLKENFKTFLKSQDTFKDYNFDGSNMNVLLDVMSYNTYLNSFYLNMVASEMFLDSAQKYDSVISHAKELNYTPRSAHASVADISFTIDTTGITGRLTIPKGTRFIGTNSNGTFTFVTDQATTYISSNSTYTVANLQVNEGSYFQDSYVVNYDIENQRFILSNQNLDANSMVVSVIENYGATNTNFTKSTTLFNLDSQSNVYFLQATQNGQYEISFGDGYFGRKPLDSSTVLVSYIVTNGSDGNGVDNFTLADDLGTINGGTANPSDITVNVSAVNGANQESIDSVRFAAPRYFAAQQRAVSSDDYSSLIETQFGGQIGAISVYGGETIEPKKYGRVIVSVKPSTGTIAPDYLKQEIVKYMENYIALPNRIEITDPDYLYTKIDTSVNYSPYETSKTASEIKSAVLTTLINYNTDYLDQFGSDLRYSKLVSAIDDTDTSIISNQTDFRIIKRLSPLLNYTSSYDIDVGNALYFSGELNTSETHINLHGSDYSTHLAHSTLITDRFTYNMSDGSGTYPFSYFEDDGHGKIYAFATISNKLVQLEQVGTINYSAGTFSLNNISLANYNNYISIYLRTVQRDIFASSNKIIVIDPTDVTITINETQR